MTEWRVSWQRAGWKNARRRHFQVRGPALALIDKLEGNDPQYARLAPLTLLSLERRAVGEWTTERNQR